MILDDLGVPYKIIEAQDRVGGRLFTKTFDDETGKPYNYYDVGAMRFPEIDAMRRLFHLFAYPPLNKGVIQLHNKLRPFFYDGLPGHRPFKSFNDITLRQDDVKLTAQLRAAEMIYDTDPTPYLAATADVPKITNDAIEEYGSALLDDLKNGGTKGWEKLMKVDHLSTRALLSTIYRPSPKLKIPNAPLPTDVVNWCETFDGSTGAYDRAFSEKVLGAIAFGWQPSSSDANEETKNNTKWWLIEYVTIILYHLICESHTFQPPCSGGATQIATCMKEYICSRQPKALTMKTRVTKIVQLSSPRSMLVYTGDRGVSHQFSHVVCTIPLPVLRTLDLTKAGLSVMQSNAIRQLSYGPSIKIGMQFREAWWTTGKDRDGNLLNIVGGQTYSDSPLRNIVYPSYGNAQQGKTVVLIASYCSVQDADKLGALVALEDSTRLRELVVRELARIHNLDSIVIDGLLIDTYAHDWSRDPNAMGRRIFPMLFPPLD